jgi:16S rRNA processing protein RimM
MDRTSASTSSTRASGARSEAKPSGVGGAGAKGARSEPQASEVRQDRARSASEVRSSEAEPEAGAGPLVLVGKILGAHGLKGELRVLGFGVEVATLRGVAHAWVETPSGGSPARHVVVRLKAGRRGELRVTLEGVARREEAEGLRNRRVWVGAQQLAPLAPGEYYAFQLVGCRVFGEGGEVVGTVREIWETGASDVLVIAGDEGDEHLVPAALVRSVDAPGRRVVVELVPGLLGDGGAD